MKTTEEVFNILKQKFGNSIIELNTSLMEPFIVVSPLEIDKIGFYLRDIEGLEFDNLMLLSGVDDANGKKSKDENGNEIETGATLSVYYHLESIKYHSKIVLKVTVPKETPELISVEEVWKSSNWHEREAYDMFGLVFLNHPDLTRILMPYDWEFGYPLRKDYKSPEFYQGMKIPY